jgi:plasmid stabilization system protein ParE
MTAALGDGHEAVHALLAAERRVGEKAPDLARRRRFRDVEHDRAPDAVRQIGTLADHLRGSVQVVAGARRLDARRDLLLGQRPVPDLDRPRGLGEVEDDVLVPAEARLVGGEMCVASAGVEVAMRAGAAGVPGRELPRMRRIAHIPDQHASRRRAPGQIRRAAAQRLGDEPGDSLPRDVAQELRRRALEGGKHQLSGDLDLERRGVGRSRHERHEPRRRWLRHVEHAPAAMPEVGGVEEPALAVALQRQLEPRAAAEVVVRDQVEVASGDLPRRPRTLVGARRQPHDGGAERHGAQQRRERPSWIGLPHASPYPGGAGPPVTPGAQSIDRTRQPGRRGPWV